MLTRAFVIDVTGFTFKQHAMQNTASYLQWKMKNQLYELSEIFLQFYKKGSNLHNAFTVPNFY